MDEAENNVGGNLIINILTGESITIPPGAEDQVMAAGRALISRIERARKGKQSKRREKFLMLLQEANKEVSWAHKRYSYAERAIFGAILPVVDYGGVIRITQSQLALKCGASRGAVSKAFRKFVEDGILEQTELKADGRKYYRMVEKYAQKGARSLPESKQITESVMEREAEVIDIVTRRRINEGRKQ